ncbi:MAG: TRAP transporter small permease [Desulfobacterales bacterium]|nr:MAG: TRAP transporter small permease [Desulfobacterales bacterium]
MRQVNNVLLLFCRYAIIVMVPVMAAVIFVQVVLRYVFLSPFSWAEELSRYLLVWITCLGSAYALRDGMHISISFMRNKFKGPLQTIVTVAIHLVTLGFFIYCIKEGYAFAASQWTQRSTAMQIPMTFPLMAIPLGFGIMFLVGLESFMAEIRPMFKTNVSSWS